MPKKTEKHKKHPREKEEIPEPENERLIEEGLTAIYGDEDMDFTKMDHKKRGLTTVLLSIVILLGLIAGVGWTTFIVYNQYFRAAQSEQFSVTIESQDALVSGEETEIVIHYSNLTRTPIAFLELDIRLPQTFETTSFSSEPDNRENLIWNIGNLGGNETGTIRIQGVWYAEVPSSLPVQVLANYRPGNFNADFQTIRTKYIDTQESKLSVEFSGPKEAIAGEEVDYVITVKNDADISIHDSVIDLTLPEGFFLRESDPELTAGESPLWIIDALEPEEEREITFTGTFTSETEGFQYFTTEAFIIRDDARLVQVSEEGFTDVLGSDLRVQLIANGGVSHIYPEAGDILRISLSYENTGDSMITNGSILLQFVGDGAIPINWSDAKMDGGVITSDGILWNTTQFGVLEPGREITRHLTFPINKTIGVGQAHSFNVTAVSEIGNTEARSSTVNVSLNSSAKLTAHARYYNEQGAPIGTGPHPPKVGEETSYRIAWNIENDLHDLKDVVVSATLPPHVTWVGNEIAQSGVVTYDEGPKVIRWTIQSLANDLDSVTATFHVRVTPEEDDIGTFLRLMSGSLLTATDAETGETVEATIEGVTTDLEEDEYVSGNSVVIE